MYLARQRVEGLARALRAMQQHGLEQRIVGGELIEGERDVALVARVSHRAEVNAAVDERQHHVVAVAAVIEH
jgi:hypothetical protein